MLYSPGCVLTSKAMLWLPSRLLLGVTVALRPGVWWVFTHICQVNGGGHCGAAGGPSWPSPPALSRPNPGGASEAGACRILLPSGPYPLHPRGLLPQAGRQAVGAVLRSWLSVHRSPPGRAPGPPALLRGTSSPGSAPLSRDHLDFCSGTPPPATVLSVTAFLKVEG